MEKVLNRRHAYVAQQPLRIYLLTPKNWFWGEMYQTERARTLSD